MFHDLLLSLKRSSGDKRDDDRDDGDRVTSDHGCDITEILSLDNQPGHILSVAYIHMQTTNTDTHTPLYL